MEGRHFVPQRVKNKRRRTVLLFSLTTAAAFVVGKIFGDHDSYILPWFQGPVKKTEFSNFTITESEDEMTLAGKDGDPIFIVDKKSFK